MQLLRPYLLAALVLLPAATLHAQDRDDFRGWADTTFAFDANGRVELAQVTGDVIVRTWTRNEIRIVAYAERVPLDIRLSRASVYIGLDMPDRSGRNGIGDSQFEVTVPATARVTAKSVSGDVSVEGSRGRLSAGSVSGDVTVEGGNGEITLSSVSGDVILSRATGRVSANAVNGDVVLSDIEGDVTATTVSGDVRLQRVRARLVTGKTVSGDVEFQGPFSNDGRYELTTHSGDIELYVQDRTNGTLAISTFSGEVDSDIPLSMGAGARRGRGNSSVEAELGNGNGATIVLKTFGGDVLIRRAR
ncbi:MAG TPA: DUF4097 family beta strand repeat-containing protein [Gemmatimonadales bacterium]|nr:DUF4097 family beta strand repeat-containing protein [Gemmatimonadales bacterium]